VLEAHALPLRAVAASRLIRRRAGGERDVECGALVQDELINFNLSPK
jgi:hypothetical protein